ncbi:MAG: EamA family transporter RarD [Candidatus Sumerlaeia bacterium]|nr:EamA family transporter RarD [Candidatus Sumerlaeia bacterium]
MIPGDDAERRRRGLANAVGAYAFWGVVTPLYFKVVAAVPPVEVLGHRTFWSMVFLAALLAWGRSFDAVRAVFRSRRALAMIAASACLIGLNWGVFIYSVSSKQLSQSSLGYYINPLVSVLLGRLVLGERLTRAQWWAVALAACAVGVLVVAGGVFPWIALVLAFSFGAYGLLRKLAPVDPVAGLFLECAALAPLALGYAWWADSRGVLAFGHVELWRSGWLALAGVVTSVPLIWYVRGARLLPLSTMGVLQYISPSGQLLIAVLLFGEAFTGVRAVAFGLIWCAVALYVGEGRRARGAAQKAGSASS